MSENLQSRERLFSLLVAGTILAVLLIGFSRSLFLLPFFAGPPEWAAKEPIFYAHGAIFASWYALLGAQVALVRTREVRVHRRLGWFGAGLAVLVVAAGTLAALRASNRPGGFIGVPQPPDQFLALPLLSMVLFALFVALAVLWRKDAPRHKRLMLLASIGLLGAPVARIVAMTGFLPAFSDVILYALLVALMLAWDVAVFRRPRVETLVGGGAVVGLNALVLPFGTTAAWLAIAHPLMRLVPPP